MSGWIKFDKDLPDTMRFRRVVRTLRNSNALRGVTESNEQLAVTIVRGALMGLWGYADSHIAHNNLLAITLDEINALVGVEGFAQALPTDWLVVIDADHVELPDFLQHNGTSAKQRQDGARRQATYRHKHHSRNVTEESRVTNTRNDARPDLDQTRPYTEAYAPAADATADHERQLQALYPKLTGRPDWLSALRAARQLVETGQCTWDGLIAAVTRYAAFVAADGVSGPQYVLRPVIFFTAPDRPWSLPWDPPPKAETETEKRVSREAAELQQLADSRESRGLSHCRAPTTADNPETYATYLKLAERDVITSPARARDLGVAGLAASMRMPA